MFLARARTAWHFASFQHQLQVAGRWDGRRTGAHTAEAAGCAIAHSSGRRPPTDSHSKSANGRGQDTHYKARVRQNAT